MNAKSLWSVLLPVVFVASSQAQTTLFGDDFNSASGTVAGYTFGDVANASRTYTDGVGVGGSRAVLVQSDFTAPGVGYGGNAYQYQNANVVGNSSINWSDYTVSFDAKVNVANGGFAFTVQSWTDPSFGGTQTGQLNTSSDIQLATADTFQHFDINLGTLDNNAGVGDGSFDATGKTWQLAFQMDEFTYGTAPTTGNQLVIDNVQVAMVPEPSAFALGAVGAMAGLVMLRRRRA